MQKEKYLKDTVGVLVIATLTFVGGMIFLLSTESALAENQSSALLVSPIKVSLSSDTQKIVPGKPFTLFVDFAMEPGWHIYYKDPGQSGLPTQVDLTVPKGFTAQALKWPTAETFKEAGIVTYGYSKNARLSTIVTASKGLKSGDSVKIKAVAQWLACKHSCVPGNSSISLDLKVH